MSSSHDRTAFVGEAGSGPPAITPTAMADHYDMCEEQARIALEGAASTAAVKKMQTETGECVYWWADNPDDS